jgi:hypothetical protein
MKNFNEWLEKRDIELYSEINWKKLALGGALAASTLFAPSGAKADTYATSPYQARLAKAQIDKAQIAKKIMDGKGGLTLSPKDWAKYAQDYPKEGNFAKFVPHPTEVGKWIPAGKADAVNIKTLDGNTTFTPYQGGKPIK